MREEPQDTRGACTSLLYMPGAEDMLTAHSKGVLMCEGRPLAEEARRDGRDKDGGIDGQDVSGAGEDELAYESSKAELERTSERLARVLDRTCASSLRGGAAAAAAASSSLRTLAVLQSSHGSDGSNGSNGPLGLREAPAEAGGHGGGACRGSRMPDPAPKHTPDPAIKHTLRHPQENLVGSVAGSQAAPANGFQSADDKQRTQSPVNSLWEGIRSHTAALSSHSALLPRLRPPSPPSPIHPLSPSPSTVAFPSFL